LKNIRLRTSNSSKRFDFRVKKHKVYSILEIFDERLAISMKFQKNDNKKRKFRIVRNAQKHNEYNNVSVMDAKIKWMLKNFCLKIDLDDRFSHVRDICCDRSS